MKNKLEKKYFEASAIQRLLNHNWPGNVRELENFIQRVVCLHQKKKVQTSDLSKYFDKDDFQKSENCINSVYKEAKNKFEKKYFEDLIAISGGDLNLAAKYSQIHVATIYRKINLLGVKYTQNKFPNPTSRRKTD